MILLMGCAPDFRFASDDVSGCTTTISGKMHFPFSTSQFKEGLLVKRGGEYSFVQGKIVEKTEKGYIFDPQTTRKYGPDAEKRLYKFDEIICAIDTNSQIVYGDMPDKIMDMFRMELYVTPAKGDSTKGLRVKLNTNKKFQYCIEPGTYRIIQIIFYKTNTLNFVDCSEFLPEMTFETKPGVNNYLGDFLLDAPLKESDSYSITCWNIRRPGDDFVFALASAYTNGVNTGRYVSPSAAFKSERVKHTLSIRDSLPPGDLRTKTVIKIR